MGRWAPNGEIYAHVCMKGKLPSLSCFERNGKDCGMRELSRMGASVPGSRFT